MTDDLFDVAPVYGLNKGETRYTYPPPPGVKPNRWGWQRASDVAGVLSDPGTLARWRERLVLTGLTLDDGLLYDEISVCQEAYELNGLAEKAFVRAGGDAGARRGTAAHLSLEGYLCDGVPWGHPAQRERTEQVVKKLDSMDLELVPGSSERKVWHPLAGGVMGTRDCQVMDRRTGRIGTADLKTGKKIYSYLEYCIQEWIYDTAGWQWEGPPDEGGQWLSALPGDLLGHPAGRFAGRPVALVIHHPYGGEPEVHEVSMDVGRMAALLAEEVLRTRLDGKQAGALRPS